MNDRFMALAASYQNAVIPKFETCFNFGIWMTARMEVHLPVVLMVATWRRASLSYEILKIF